MLAFERTGSGIPLVLLHAFPLSRRMWDINKAHFSRNFQLITIDLPGFGESPVQSHVTTMESIAHQVAETLDSLNITEKIILGGVSMGGYACFRFLDMFPDRVRALALISTRSAADTAQAREGRFKTIDMVMKEGMKSLGMKSLADRMIPNLFGKTSLQEKLPLIEKVREEIEHSFPEGVCASLRGMAERPDSSPLLPSIKCPTLILRGAEDSFIPPQEMEQMAAPIPQHEFHLIPQAGHLLNMEKPDAFKDVFLHFLKRRVL